MVYEAVIGMEVHVELNTDTKAFCSCPTTYGAIPNSQCCPVCLGLPGALPVLNERAVEKAVKAALALNCDIALKSRFDRKNYFYPDLSKGYQITQYHRPLGTHGYLEVLVEGELKRIGIQRLHLEEDTGKSLHSLAEGETLLDFNRSGVPLIEIVTEPHIESAAEARAFAEALQGVFRYIDVSNVRLEEGSMRCEANVSMRQRGSKHLGALHEVKNMASFKAVEQAIAYEIKTQRQALKEGQSVIRSTMRWDEAKGKTTFMRTKGETADYHYFPDPDLPALTLQADWVQTIGQDIPQLPLARMQRYVKEFELSVQAARALVHDLAFAQYFEAVVDGYQGEPKNVAHWMLGSFRRHINDRQLVWQDLAVEPQHLASLLALVDEGAISGTIAKTVLEEMFVTGEEPQDIVDEKGLLQISNQDILEAFVEQVLEENPQTLLDIKGGKDRVLGFLVGQVMKLSGGRANPQMVSCLLREKISQL